MKHNPLPTKVETTFVGPKSKNKKVDSYLMIFKHSSVPRIPSGTCISVALSGIIRIILRIIFNVWSDHWDRSRMIEGCLIICKMKVVMSRFWRFSEGTSDDLSEDYILTFKEDPLSNPSTKSYIPFNLNVIWARTRLFGRQWCCMYTHTGWVWLGRWVCNKPAPRSFVDK